MPTTFIGYPAHAKLRLITKSSPMVSEALTMGPRPGRFADPSHARGARNHASL